MYADTKSKKKSDYKPFWDFLDLKKNASKICNFKFPKISFEANYLVQIHDF